MGSCFFLRFFFKPHDFVSTWFRSSSWSPSGAIWGLGLGGCCWDFFLCLHSRSKMMVKFYIYLVLMRTWCITYCSTLRIICIWRFSLKSKAYLYEKKWGEWFVESAISVWASYGIIWTWIQTRRRFPSDSSAFSSRLSTSPSWNFGLVSEVSPAEFWYPYSYPRVWFKIIDPPKRWFG